MRGDNFIPRPIQVHDHLAFGTVGDIRLGRGRVVLLDDPLKKLSRLRPGLVVALPEHLAKLARANLTLWRNGRHGGS